MVQRKQLADLNLYGNQLKGAVMDVQSSTPANVKPGQVWFDPITGKLMFADEQGLPVDPTDRAKHHGTQLASTISNFDTQVRTSRLDQMAAPTAPVDINGQTLSNVAAGNTETDAVNLGQLNDGFGNLQEQISRYATGQFLNTPVYAVSATNIPLNSRTFTSVDGAPINLASNGYWLLLLGQTDASQNGMWYVPSDIAGGGAWQRFILSNNANVPPYPTLASGTLVAVANGDKYRGCVFEYFFQMPSTPPTTPEGFLGGEWKLANERAWTKQITERTLAKTAVDYVMTTDVPFAGVGGSPIDPYAYQAQGWVVIPVISPLPEGYVAPVLTVGNALWLGQVSSSLITAYDILEVDGSNARRVRVGAQNYGPDYQLPAGPVTLKLDDGNGNLSPLSYSATSEGVLQDIPPSGGTNSGYALYLGDAGNAPEGSTVLLTGQLNKAENGIWVVHEASPWLRPVDAYGNPLQQQGELVKVLNDTDGTYLNTAGTLWTSKQIQNPFYPDETEPYQSWTRVITEDDALDALTAARGNYSMGSHMLTDVGALNPNSPNLTAAVRLSDAVTLSSTGRYKLVVDYAFLTANVPLNLSANTGLQVQDGNGHNIPDGSLVFLYFQDDALTAGVWRCYAHQPWVRPRDLNGNLLEDFCELISTKQWDEQAGKMWVLQKDPSGADQGHYYMALITETHSLNHLRYATDNYSMNGHKLQFLAPGVDGSDSATYGQLTTAANQILARTLDQIPVAVAPVNLNGQRLTNGAPSQGGTDFVIRSELDGAINGLSWKEAVRVATTVQTTLSGLQTVDGVQLVDGDRVLVKAQTTASQNGIYIAHSGAWTRAADAVQGTLDPSSAVFVQEGTTQADQQWKLITDGPITVGTTALTWTQMGGVVAYYAGDGLQLTGQTFSVINRMQRAVALVGGATTAIVAHNLGTRDVTVQVYEDATGDDVDVAISRTDANHVTLSFATAPDANSLRVVVMG